MPTLQAEAEQVPRGPGWVYLLTNAAMPSY